MADVPRDRSAPSAGAGDCLSFPAFVLSLAHTAGVHFGDVVDPSTGRLGVPNLPAARRVIDILEMLEARTRGNLSAEERQLVEQLIAELRQRHADAAASTIRHP